MPRMTAGEVLPDRQLPTVNLCPDNAQRPLLARRGGLVEQHRQIVGHEPAPRLFDQIELPTLTAP